MMTLRVFKRRYEKGDFSKSNFSVQVEAGWFDWFCPTKELSDRLKKIWEILEKVTSDFILDNYYVWFKNNCPCEGPLYDSVSFTPLDETRRESMSFAVSIDCYYEENKYTVHTARNHCQPEAGFDTVAGVADFINNWENTLCKYDQKVVTSLRSFLRRYEKGDFLKADLESQKRAGWRKWACSEEELPERLKKFWEILKGVKSDYLLDNYRVYFQNSQPSAGTLFDEIRFDPVDNKKRYKLHFGVAIDCNWNAKKYVIFTARREYREEAAFNTLDEVVEFLNNWENTIEEA